MSGIRRFSKVLVAIVFAAISFSSTQSCFAQAIQKKEPYRLFKNGTQLGITVTGALVVIGGTMLSRTACDERAGSVGFLGVISMIFGSVTVSNGLNYDGPEFELSRVTPALVTPINSKSQKSQQDLVKVGEANFVWSALLRSCRVAGQSGARSDDVLTAATYGMDSLSGIQDEAQRVKQLCAWISAVDSKAKEMKRSKTADLRDVSEDIVGRKLTNRDAIIFSNLFTLAGVYSQK